MTGGASPGLRGHLDLTCAADADGRSFLSRQSFRAPIHISKPHSDSGVLVVNVVSPTAGLFAGDRVACRVAVEPGAAMLLTAPSALRVHRMREGCAEMTQDLHVAAGAWLETWPELLILQGGARYRQRTRIVVEPGGELLFTESLAPGRVAFGEVFAFTDFHCETDVFSGATQVVRERYGLHAGSSAITALRGKFDAAYSASCFAISPRLVPELGCWQRLHELQSERLVIGCSALNAGGWVVKCVADGSVALRRALHEIRRELHAALERPLPSLRRAGWL